IRGVGARADRDDPPTGPAVAVALDDRRVPDLPRHGPCVPARGGGAPDGALPEARRCRAPGTPARRAAAPRGGPVPRGAGAELLAPTREADGTRARGPGRSDAAPRRVRHDGDTRRDRRYGPLLG